MADKQYLAFNGALLHFFQHSPYLCEAFHIMKNSPEPRLSYSDWGQALYLKLWTRLIAESIPPFKVLPFCFADARSCRLDNRLPDPFQPDPVSWGGVGPAALVEGGKLDRSLRKVFAVHLHGKFDQDYPVGGWIERLLLRRHDMQLPNP